MNFSTYIIITILTIVFGLLYSIKINWHQIGLSIIMKDIEKYKTEGSIYHDIDKEVENMLTIENIIELGKMELHIKVLGLLNKKMKLKVFYTEGLDIIISHIKRLKKYKYPVTEYTIDTLVNRWKSILKTNHTDFEKKDYLNTLIEKFEGHMFLITHYPDNYDDESFSMHSIKGLTEKDLKIIDFTITTFNEKSIFFSEKLKICEDYRLSLLLKD